MEFEILLCFKKPDDLPVTFGISSLGVCLRFESWNLRFARAWQTLPLITTKRVGQEMRKMPIKDIVGSVTARILAKAHARHEARYVLESLGVDSCLEEFTHLAQYFGL